jgi:hypothetical protein
MKCKYSETDLALYVEGDVVSAKACEIQAHLSVCTQCRDLVIELRESQAVLKTLKQESVRPTSLALCESHVLGGIQARVKPVLGALDLCVNRRGLCRRDSWMLELRKSQVQEIVKSDPLPPPAAVPLTRGTIIGPNANTDIKTRPPARTMERVNVPCGRGHSQRSPTPSRPRRQSLSLSNS